MASPPLLNDAEIIFYDERFRITDQVQESLVSVFPGRVVIGDPTRADDPLASSYVMTDWTGGLLKKKMLPSTDFDRFRWSTGATWFSQQLSLGPAVKTVTLTAPQQTELSGKNVRSGAVFNDLMYVAFDDKLVRVNADDTVTVIGTIPNTIQSLFVYRNMAGVNNGASRLMIAYRTGYQIYDGATITAGVTGEPASYFEIWDGKLIKLDYQGAVKWTMDVDGGATTWTTGGGTLGVVPLPYDSCTGLLLFPNAQGEDALHIVTTSGLFFYDESATRVRRTKVTFPALKGRGQGSTVYEDNVYLVQPGMGISRYTGSTLGPVGLDRDDGLPKEQRGRITQLAGALNFLVAASETMSEIQLGNPVFPGSGYLAGGGPFWADTVYASQGFAAIYGYTGSGWHVLYSSDQTGSGCKWVGAGSTGNNYRLWFGMNGVLSYITLYPDIANIVENNLQEFRTSATHQTPFNDTGWVELSKLALSVNAEAEGMENGGSIQIQYALNRDENNWYTLGTITQNRPAPFVFGVNGVGVEFKSIAFRFLITRGASATSSPVLRAATLKFLKSMESRYGYRLTVDCSQDGFQGRTPEEQYAKLKALASKVELGTFKAWCDGVLVERKVKVSTMSSLIRTGNNGSASVNMAVVAFDGP